ncbi:phosphodiester glycosidase family protein [Agromyces silvae]|uniref:phosphodiester glycosidase family protein n=1 Tax=Agromyces silvae TaxID=3388266 RepID=UPI00280B88D5|nr:phosphodiester glycosidase family protein [Agromyces protaetiae]
MRLPQHTRERRVTRVAALAVAAAIATGGLAAAPTAVAPALAAPDTRGLDLTGGDSSLLTADTETLAPGLELTDFRRLQPAGWVTGHVMRADLTTPTLSLDVLDGGTVTGGATLTEQIADTGAVAAVNGDYFDMNASVAPVGTNVSPSEGLRTASGGPRQAFTITDGIAAVQQLLVQGTVTIAGSPTPLGGVNTPGLAANAIGWYTPAWGTHPLSRPLGGPGALASQVAMAVVQDGVVQSVTTDPAAISADAAIAGGTGVLIGREAGATTLAALTPGDAVDVVVGTSADVDLAVSGSQRMIVDGVQTDEDQVEAARTAIGVNRDGTEITVVSIDGRATDSRGMTIRELGDLMLDLGVHNAVNLDGGGSTMLAARRAGTTEAQIANRPSDGSERVVANSLAFFSSAPAGAVTDVSVAPASGAANADAVFPRLGRTIAGTGLDANLTGVAVDGQFVADAALELALDLDPADAAPSSGATVRAVGVTSGRGGVTFTAEGKSATTGLRVLGELARIRPSSTVVALPEPGQTARVTLSGLDADGFDAPLETQDVQVVSGADVTVTADGRDRFLITPNTESGSATVTFTADGRSVDVAVTIGYRSLSVADFADGTSWATAADRATGTMTPSTGPNGEPALRMSYDFASSTGTRGYYAVAPEMATAGSLGRQLEGQPQALTLWINGDGSGVWPRIQMKNGAGTTINLDGPNVTWTGWQQARFTVPAGTPYPLHLQRIRMLETRSAVSYQGQVEIAGLESIVAPDVDQPVAPVVHDPVIVTNGTVDSRAQRIAVMSDSQFVARSPESDAVQGARQTLREILAAEPDLLVINGDFVDEATPADYELAQRILDEEIGDRLPYVYVPGNHEIMGGPIANFEAAFGDTTTASTLGRTKLVTLNTAAGSFRASEASQLAFLEDELADASADSSITGVLVFAHHPIDDPQPAKASQLSDRTEAAAFGDALAGFRADTGKSIALVNAHVGVFHATAFDGVSQLTNGNSGKSPSGTPATGGFTGWTMLGVNPGTGVVGTDPVTVLDRTRWMQAEVHARVDDLTLDAPTILEVGETVPVSATITQDGGREVPVAWPMSASWGGDGVAVDDGALARLERAVAATDTLRLNPETGELTALAAGEASLAVTVNGVTETVDVTVAAAPVDPTDPGTGPTDPGTDPTDPGTGPTGPGTQPGPGQGADPAGTGGDAASGDLADTGFDNGWLVWVAVGLVVVGGVVAAIVVIRRHRQEKTTAAE